MFSTGGWIPACTGMTPQTRPSLARAAGVSPGCQATTTDRNLLSTELEKTNDLQERQAWSTLRTICTASSTWGRETSRWVTALNRVGNTGLIRKP